VPRLEVVTCQDVRREVTEVEGDDDWHSHECVPEERNVEEDVSLTIFTDGIIVTTGQQ
jgi:hypothetical protein